MLPDHREWVRHDLTDAGWRIRVVRRVLWQALPIAVALALLPGPLGLRLSLPLILLLPSGFTAAAYAEQLRNHRLGQHGLPRPPRAGAYPPDAPADPAAPPTDPPDPPADSPR